MAKSKGTSITVTADQRKRLEGIRSGLLSTVKHAQRAAIVLRLGDGLTLSQTMRATGMSKPTVWRWWDRFLVEDIDGLLRDVRLRPDRSPVSGDREKELIDLAMSPPPAHARHWTLRELAKRTGMPASTVFKVLKRNGLKPHRVKTFKVSRDPKFEERIRDVVGLQVDPPDHAVVLSVDGKTQIQALGRTQTPLPMTVGHAEPRTHDCKRNGTTCLLAASDTVIGKVIGQMIDRHRPKEFLEFPDHIDAGIKARTAIHVILDYVSSHKSAEVNDWLKEHPDWRFHFRPTSASWTNAVERFLSKPARQRLKNAVFNSVDEYVSAIGTFIAHHNSNGAAPFKWSRHPEEPVASWKRGHQKLQELA